MTTGADDLAKQIMVIAFTDPNAREVIADVVALAYLNGRLSGIGEARKIFKEHQGAEE